jgi:putative toxin-antitoxin system antitoxin component (TIGR02293 family)
MKSSTPKEKVYKEYPTNEDDFSSMVSEPAVVYASSFNDMVTVSNYDKEYAADLLDVSYKTITRYQKEKKKFSPLQSEYVLKTIALYKKGESVFGSTQSFKNWLSKPAFGLGNRIPNNFIPTITGINFIIDELNRIAHGDLA